MTDKKVPEWDKPLDFHLSADGHTLRADFGRVKSAGVRHDKDGGITVMYMLSNENDRPSKITVKQDLAL